MQFDWPCFEFSVQDYEDYRGMKNEEQHVLKMFAVWVEHTFTLLYVHLAFLMVYTSFICNCFSTVLSVHGISVRSQCEARLFVVGCAGLTVIMTFPLSVVRGTWSYSVPSNWFCCQAAVCTYTVCHGARTPATEYLSAAEEKYQTRVSGQNKSSSFMG
jgi:hypothetical protein